MMEIGEETRRYIREHAADDVRQLALSGCKNCAVDFPYALQQIEGRQKARYKLPELYDNPAILYPPTLSMEQCSSSRTALYKSSLMTGTSFCDVTGGFGVDTLAFAQKFARCTYIEPREELCRLLEHNATALGINNIDILNGTMEKCQSQIPNVDLILIDPSRRDSHGQRVVSLEDCTPNLLECKDVLLNKAQTVMVKLSPMLDLKRAMMQLPETQSVHVVAVDGECKEILFLLTHKPIQNPPFVCANLSDKGDSFFTFAKEAEEKSVSSFAKQVGEYLYEPNAAVMKAGAFKSVGANFGLHKLHPHTHLYTSHELDSTFPGRIFRVKDAFPFHKQEVKTHLKGIGQANVAVRNFPLTAEELKQRLKLHDGGNLYLFGATTLEGKMLIVTEKSALI